MLSNHNLHFVPPPWVKAEPRKIYADPDTSLYDILLNYSLFFWKGQDMEYIPGFFCFLSPKGFYYMDLIPGFYLTKLSDFIKANEVMEIGYIVHRDAKIPPGFVGVRKKIVKFIRDLNEHFSSYNKVRRSKVHYDIKG